MSALDMDRQCSYATHSAEYCHAHGGYLIDYDTGMCDKYAIDKATRWDARDEALRGLVEKWRERTVTVMPSALTAADTERLTWAAAADELKRAIGGAK